MTLGARDAVAATLAAGHPPPPSNRGLSPAATRLAGLRGPAARDQLRVRACLVGRSWPRGSRTADHVDGRERP
ncbi:hypothetical protein FRACA_1010007 [Frankia canadensis]|uniref:Uncharacterized protein n=1 Tax=Frankia canadensis TaxID=1836972 RepID=A0A2I2KIQ0_9ACTN|nr:hypothetical protein FRACA_1010007 [Frankia canadensis]SOU52819.1 hypothetical protein FRACA_1010007 [Frankia canadensis]